MNLWKAVCALLLVVPGWADITVVRGIQTDGFMGMGGGLKEATTWTAGDKQREEKKGSAKPSMIEKMAGIDKPEITRLDKKVRWTLDVPGKSYSEMSLIPPKTAESDPTGKEKEDSKSPEEKPTVKVTKAEFSVQALNQKKAISGFSCEGYEMRAEIETENLETKERSGMKMITTLWTTAETGAVAALKKEEEAYAKAWREMIGMDASSMETLKTLGASMVAGMAGAGEKDLAKALAKAPAEMKKVKGYPISTRVEWFGSGESAPAQNDAANVDDAALDSMKSMGGMFGDMAANLAKKKADQKSGKKTGPSPMFAMTTEVKSISTASLPASTFEIPAGFKKR